jgi:sugar (pentulose or hexulose) kinase
MDKYFITIDLGTTVLKFVIFDKELKELSSYAINYELDINGDFVEFDAEYYWQKCIEGVSAVLLKSAVDGKKVASITISSQAETLVVLDKDLNPLRKAISWLDSRSTDQCSVLKGDFDVDEGYLITGQPDIITTWPITKILWLKDNEKQVFKKAYKYLLIKDYIIYRFTGNLVSEYTVYNFSYYFDITRKKYWEEILDYAGISEDKLPKLIEPGEYAGTIRKELTETLGLSDEARINAGALDHMAGMIGTGNIKEGIVSETTGTVIAICTLVEKPMINRFKIPCHYNAIKDTYILLPVCESGGISLEWFKNNFYENEDFRSIDKQVSMINAGSDGLIFLPYITGVNSPEYDPDAKGVFYNIKISHKKAHFARAILESIAYLIKKNISYLEQLNIKADRIISLGGGAKSDIWCRIKADIIEKEIVLTANNEAASLGAAMIGAVKEGVFKDYGHAVEKLIEVEKTYYPKENDIYKRQYEIFLEIYEKLK